MCILASSVFYPPNRNYILNFPTINFSIKNIASKLLKHRQILKNVMDMSAYIIIICLYYNVTVMKTFERINTDTSNIHMYLRGLPQTLII